MNNLNNIPGEIIKTSQLPEDMPTHLVGVILGTSPKTVKYSTTLFASQIASQMTNVVSTSFVYSDPTWLGSLNWNKIINTPSTILGYGITDAVSSSRTLSINGTTYDLSANRSWTVGDVLSSSSYSDPSWITSLAWTKISGAPAFLTAESDTLASVTGRGNSTTNAITVGGITTNGSFTASGGTAIANYISPTLVATANNDILYALQINPTFNNSGGYSNIRSNHINLISNGRINGTNQINLLLNNIGIVVGLTTSTAISSYISSVPLLLQVGQATFGQFSPTTGNFILQNGGSFTDSGFRLDVNGTARIQNQLTTTGSITAASAIARGVYMNNTLVASANNDVLTALEINPTFTNGAFTGVGNNWINLIGNAAINGTNQIYIRRNNIDVFFASSVETIVKSISTGSPLRFSIGATKVGEFSLTTGNLILQNGGTFTDSGFRLDVVGADARINGIRIGLGAGNIGTNLVLGASALNNNTTGGENVAIGSSSMAVNTIGGRNIAIGDTSLYSNISGGNNVAIGMSSQRLATNANYNTSIGFATLNNNGSGSGNVAIGSFAGRFISGGSTIATSITNSILIGSFAYPLADSQSNQIVIGTNSVGLGSNTTIIGNSSTVTTALYGNLLLGTTTATGAGLTVSNAITASSAIARGVYFNQTLTATANNDVLVGLDIQPTFTNGAFTGVSNIPLRIRNTTNTGNIYSIDQIGNCVIGGSLSTNSVYASGNLNLSSGGNDLKLQTNYTANTGLQMFNATRNVVIQNGGTFTDAGFRLDVVGADSRFNGIRAGLGAGQVASNTVFGNGALGSNSTGTGVTAIGFEALKVSTGNNNTAFGYRVGVGITTGVNNTGVGHFALTNNGSNNTAVGMYAYTYGTGNSNTAIGLQSLYNTGSSNSNTAIGYQTLTSNTGNLNTAVGYQSGNANTSGANNTLLGANTVTGNFSGCLILGKDATATANNQFVVGSSTVNAGAVITATSPTINEYWTVIINGVSKKIALIS